MSDKFDNQDGFWNLEQYKKTTKKPSMDGRSFSNTDAVEVTSKSITKNTDADYRDSRITKFIPPHNDSIYKNKYIIKEYSPNNLFVKTVKIISDKPEGRIFIEDNLFIRERRALLNRTCPECPYVPYYSISPRYSSMNKSQLKWYIWWRENIRKGTFIKTDISYILLYVYELVSIDEGDSTEDALDMLCSLVSEYSDKDLPIPYKMIIMDTICDFCILYNTKPSSTKMIKINNQIIMRTFLPEIFISFNESSNSDKLELINSSLSLYDYRRSKFYTPENQPIFKEAINGALSAVISNKDAFDSITSFTNGLYGYTTLERNPFTRMTNIVNKGIKLEISYFELSKIQPAITDIVRYSENRVREHIGIKNKINVMSINPIAQKIIDEFFDSKYPKQPTVDRRRRDFVENATEKHEYDKYYDIPNVAFSAENAEKIEQESWETTKILIDAFTDESDYIVPIPQSYEKSPESPQKANTPDISCQSPIDSNPTICEIRKISGDICDFIYLCIDANAKKQKEFSIQHGCSADEIADRINEAALDIVGDIILEQSELGYTIIEDYKDLF